MSPPPRHQHPAGPRTSLSSLIPASTGDILDHRPWNHGKRASRIRRHVRKHCTRIRMYFGLHLRLGSPRAPTELSRAPRFPPRDRRFFTARLPRFRCQATLCSSPPPGRLSVEIKPSFASDTLIGFD